MASNLITKISCKLCSHARTPYSAQKWRKGPARAHYPARVSVRSLNARWLSCSAWNSTFWLKLSNSREKWAICRISASDNCFLLSLIRTIFLKVYCVGSSGKLGISQLKKKLWIWCEESTWMANARSHSRISAKLSNLNTQRRTPVQKDHPLPIWKQGHRPNTTKTCLGCPH